MKPSEVTCYVDDCPICGKPGEGLEYKALDPDLAKQYYVEFVVNHSVNDQTRGRAKDVTRNNFCYTGYTRQSLPEERIFTWHASPIHRPDWLHIRSELRKRKGGGQRTLV